MKSFYEWLVGVDGGLKPIRSAMQHRSVVMSVVHMLYDPVRKDYANLFSRSELNSWLTFVKNKKRKPGIIKTYLGSIQMKTIISQWCRNYLKKIQISKHERQLEDLSRIPTPNDLRNLDMSNLRKEALKLLSSLSSTYKEPSRREFCLVRDYLFTYVIFDNGSRSGCVANMTLKEFRKAEAQPNGYYIISVMDHKTVATSGPAML